MADVVWPVVSEYHRDYKVLRQIASGAFGSVHCVQRRDTKVIQAAKYVKSSEEDLRREIEALLALRRSNLILQFVAFYVSEPPKLCQSVLVTEFLAGGDLIERTSCTVSLYFSYSFHILDLFSDQTRIIVVKIFQIWLLYTKLPQFWSKMHEILIILKF